MLNPEQKAIHEAALQVSQNFRRSETELIDLIQKVEEKRVFVALGHSSLFIYCTKSLLLSEANAQSLISIARKSKTIPELKVEILNGNIPISKAQRIVSVINQENKAEWIKKASALSKRDLEREVVKVQPQKVRESLRPVAEDRVKLQLGISESVLTKFKRAQALLSSKKRRPANFEEVLEASLDRFLEKDDPLEKAKRAEKRRAVTLPGQGGMVPVEKILATPRPSKIQKKRIPIPSSIRHEVFQRDQGRCQYKNAEGIFCKNSYFIDLHHRRPVSRGGSNAAGNLLTLCSTHHRYLHDESSGYFAN